MQDQYSILVINFKYISAQRQVDQWELVSGLTTLTSHDAYL